MQVDKSCVKYKLKNDQKPTLESSDPSQVVFPTSLQEAVDKIAKQEGYKQYVVEKKKILSNGGNFLGILYTIDIKGETAEGPKETNVFLKRIIANGNSSLLVSITTAYLYESFTYNELFKIYNDLQNEACIPKEDRFNIIKSYNVSNGEAIFLDNLAKKGFKTNDRMKVMSYKFAELSVIQLARFHGLSMVVQEKIPDYFKQKLKHLKVPFTFNEYWKKFVFNIHNETLKELNSDSKKKVEGLDQITVKTMPQYYSDNSLFGNCICHGDYRQNNIMMRETDGEVAEVIGVDYQLIYHGCPLIDLMYFLFTASDQEFRRKHLTDLKNVYYGSLEKFLSYFEIDVNTIYPKQEYEKQFKEKLYYGLLISIQFIPFCLGADDDLPDMEKDDLSNIKLNINNIMKDRIQGIVDDFRDWGYL